MLKFKTLLAVISMGLLVLLATSGCQKKPIDLPELEESLNPSEGETGDASLTRLHSNPRLAIKYECFYALNPSHNGSSNRHITYGYGTWTVSDWNYLANDMNAYNLVKSWYRGCSSMWKGPHSGDPSSPCTPYKHMHQNCFYHYPQNYGIFGTYGRGGQCKFFTQLIMYRSGVHFRVPGYPPRRIPSYQDAINDFYGPRRFTRPATKARVGDILYTKWPNGHTAIVVRIIAGRPGRNVRVVDVVDSNFITWGGQDEEIIARHKIDRNWSGLWDLDNYFVVALDKILTE